MKCCVCNASGGAGAARWTPARVPSSAGLTDAHRLHQKFLSISTASSQSRKFPCRRAKPRAETKTTPTTPANRGALRTCCLHRNHGAASPQAAPQVQGEEAEAHGGYVFRANHRTHEKSRNPTMLTLLRRRPQPQGFCLFQAGQASEDCRAVARCTHGLAMFPSVSNVHADLRRSKNGASMSPRSTASPMRPPRGSSPSSAPPASERRLSSSP